MELQIVSRKRKVEIIEDSRHTFLQHKINEFIEKEGVEVIDIKYNVVVSDNHGMFYSALIYYNEVTK